MPPRNSRPPRPENITLDEPAGDDRDYETPIEPLLAPDEKILWHGQPDPSVHTSPMEYYLVPFSLILLLVGILWAISFSAGGWIFVIGGLYAVFGRFFWKAHRKRLTYYAVTDRRIVRLAGRKGKAQPFAEIPDIQLRVRSSGNGTIRFSDRPAFTVVYQNSGMDWVSLFGNPDEISFWDIPDALHVHEIVMEHVYKAKDLPLPDEADEADDVESEPSGDDLRSSD